MLARLAALLTFAIAGAGSQEPQLPRDSPGLNDLLARVVANVARYHATLPSITADEDITSSLSQHGLYRARSTAHATLRVSPGKPGEQLDEVRTYLMLDGKPVPAGKKVSVTFELNGAFSRVADSFFLPARIPCYTFTVLPEAAPDGSIQLYFRTNPQLLGTCTNRKLVISGLARLDPATAQIRHLERSISTPAEGHNTTSIAIDYAPAMIGGQSIWLPTSLTAELDYGKGSFSARYSNYHRYTGTVTLLPGVISGEAGTPDPALPPPAQSLDPQVDPRGR